MAEVVANIRLDQLLVPVVCSPKLPEISWSKDRVTMFSKIDLFDRLFALPPSCALFVTFQLTGRTEVTRGSISTLELGEGNASNDDQGDHHHQVSFATKQGMIWPFPPLHSIILLLRCLLPVPHVSCTFSLLLTESGGGSR